MDHEERNKSGKGYQQFRAILHVGMGSFYLLIGGLVLYIKQFGSMDLSSGLAYPLGVLILLYGIFRLWRGITDMRRLPKRDMRRDFPGLADKKQEN